MCAPLQTVYIALKAFSSSTPPAHPSVLLASSVTLQMASASPAPLVAFNASVPPAQIASPALPQTSSTFANSHVLLTVLSPTISTLPPSPAKVFPFLTVACDPNCAECFGPSADECEACAPGRNLKMNSCSRCEDTPGFTADPFDDGLCIEICGDGLDLGFNECEDGNLFNLDGCSSDCKLELDFECTSTSPTGPFHCKSLKPPTIIFAAITDDMALELYFSEPISTTSTVTL